MRVGILTMPLKTNYGGLVQAYALQTILERMGCEVEILSRCYPKQQMSFFAKLRYNGIRFLRSFCGEQYKNLSEKEYKLVSVNTQQFVKSYIKQSPKLYTTEALREYTQKKQFDAYVVGSDQIWRPRYCPSIEDYYLGFTTQQSVKRIAYAASFGVDEWEYTKEETEKCSRLVQRFDAVGVREDSGVLLCSRYLGVTAKHVLDPTMLLACSDYKKIAVDASPSKGNMFCYILDHGERKDRLLKDVFLETKKIPFECMPKGPLYHGKICSNLDNSVFPAPAQWIRSFMDAEMVITDSFHGAAFSIIFNKPFWVIGNRARGLARMESLLKMFGLSERFISMECSSLNNDWQQSINWNTVNNKMESLRHESMAFLMESLYSSDES